MKNTLKKVMVAVMAFALLAGVVTVPVQSAQAAKSLAKKDVTKIKAKKGNVSPLAKYKKHHYAVAFYKKNNKNFKGTLRGIKINSTAKQVTKKYGSEVSIQKIQNTYEKQLLKKMKISGVTKKCDLNVMNGDTYNSLVIYFNKKNKVKAVLVAKNYMMLQDALYAEKEDDGKHIDIKIKGNVLYAK